MGFYSLSCINKVVTFPLGSHSILFHDDFPNEARRLPFYRKVLWPKGGVGGAMSRVYSMELRIIALF